MRVASLILTLLLPTAGTLRAQNPSASLGHPSRVIDSIPGPESVAVGPDGAWYVSSFGKFDNGADGAVYRVDPDKGTREIYAGGLEDPCGVLFVGNNLWAADRKGVYRVTRGKVELVFPAAAFPRPLNFLNDMAAGPNGTMYVSDTGDSTAAGHGAVFLLAPGKRPRVVTGSETGTEYSPNGLLPGSGDTLYVVGYRTGILSVTDGKGAWREMARGLGSPDGIDAAGDRSFYVSDNVGGDLFLVSRAPGGNPVKLASGLKSPADLVVDHRRGLLVVPENSGNRLSVYRVDHAGTQ